MPALSRRAATRALGVAVLLFVLCTAISAAGLLDDLDRQVASGLRGVDWNAADVGFSLVSLPASVHLSVAWIAILAAVASRRPRWWGRVAVLATVVLAGVAIEVVLKILIDHPGPGGSRSVVALGAFEVGRGSFPSGHAFRGTCLAFGTALLASGRRQVPALAVAAGYGALLACGLVYLSQHWTSDVIGGVLLGLVATVIVAAVPATARRARA